MENVIRQLEGMRNGYRRLIFAILAVELAAFVLIVAGQGLLGVLLGIVTMVAYFVVKHVSKHRYDEACAKAQAEATLGLTDMVYEGALNFDGSELHRCGMVSSALKIDSTMRRHALKGQRDGVPVKMSEITFGVVYPGQNRHEFNTGVMISAPMTMQVDKPVLLLGHNSFRHKLIRKEYEDDGWKLCPVGGKARGWFVFTPDGTATDQALLDRLDALNQGAENKVAVSIRNGKAKAFFMSSFYTDRYALGEPVTAAELRRKQFMHMDNFIALVK